MSDCICTIEVIEELSPIIVITESPNTVTNIVSVIDQPLSLSVVENGNYSFNFTNNWNLNSFLPTLNQTTFQLTDIPLIPHQSLVYLNGQKMFYGLDYVINSSVLTWLITELQLNEFDLLEVYFL